MYNQLPPCSSFSSLYPRLSVTVTSHKRVLGRTLTNHKAKQPNAPVSTPTIPPRAVSQSLHQKHGTLFLSLVSSFVDAWRSFRIESYSYSRRPSIRLMKVGLALDQIQSLSRLCSYFRWWSVVRLRFLGVLLWNGSVEWCHPSPSKRLSHHQRTVVDCVIQYCSRQSQSPSLFSESGRTVVSMVTGDWLLAVPVFCDFHKSVCWF